MQSQTLQSPPKQSLTTSNASSSPTKLDKKLKKKKNEAFKSFLAQTSGESKISISNNNLSDHQEQVDQEQRTDCGVCHIQLGVHRKICGFCKEGFCNDHLRKKRKHKSTGKFVRICDDCQDKHLYQKYMKYQVKAQESLLAQEMIIGAKHEDIIQLKNGKQTKVKLLLNKKNQIEKQNKQFLHKLQNQENQLIKKLQKLNLKVDQLDKLAQRLQQTQKKLPRPLDDDFNSLQQQNQKTTKQLVKYQRLCNDALQIKSKRQKQIYQNYYQWENKQKKKITPKQQDCLIF